MKRLGRLAALLVALLAVLVVVPGRTAAPAYAAGDQVDSYAIDYVVKADGSVDVTEKLVYRFGDSSGRHGIQRELLTREPEAGDTRHDIAYDYTNIAVSSPDAPAQFTTSTVNGTAPRTQYLVIRVGDPNRTVTSPTATYVLRYTIHGALRSQASYAEFYWDATGFEWQASLHDVSVSVTVPGGATDKACYVGPPKSTQTCDSVTLNHGVVTAHQGTIPAGQGLTVSAKIASGAVSNATPHLVPSALVAQQRRFAVVGGLTGLAAIIAAVGGTMIVRARRDLRFLDLPPGVVPPPGAEGRVGLSPRSVEVPVAFAPPAVSVAEAGFLLDGALEPRETAATLIDMAVHGVLKVSGDAQSGFRITLVDPGAVRAPHEAVLVQTIFGGRAPGTTVDLGAPGEMTAAHDSMVAMVRREVDGRAWFTRLPGEGMRIRVRGFGWGWLLLFIAGTTAANALRDLAYVLPLVPFVIAALVVRGRLKRGQRTAVGRALTDQVEGFRQYLATAEADQIRWEEGEDIFSKYLPWAISFDLADRWAHLCQQLVEAGRLPDVQPTWFYGPFYLPTFSWFAFADAVGNTVAPAPPVMSGGGTGFGSGGSAFGGGGGFAGGGGGGGGGGSW